MHVINKQIIRGAMIRVDERTRVDKNFRGFFWSFSRESGREGEKQNEGKLNLKLEEQQKVQ